jgi:hypothetical protein
MTGEGDNGKSVFIEILEKVLGEYMDKLPTSLITSGRTQSSGSTMDTELLRKKKFCALQETSKKDQINDGKLKELTGNDSFQSRAHSGSFTKVEATAKIALMCNKLPSIGSDDPAIWNRVRVLPFESKFPKNNDEVPVSFEEQIQKMVDISESISIGDNIETSIYTDQNWYLQDIHGFYTCYNTYFFLKRYFLKRNSLNNQCYKYYTLHICQGISTLKIASIVITIHILFIFLTETPFIFA